MAGLAETSLEVLVGIRPPGALTAELVSGDTAVSARQPVVDWYTQGSTVAGTVEFGPVPSLVTFDAVRLYHGDQQLFDLPRSVTSLEPGDTFTQDIRLNGREL